MGDLGIASTDSCFPIFMSSSSSSGYGTYSDGSRSGTPPYGWLDVPVTAETWSGRFEEIREPERDCCVDCCNVVPHCIYYHCLGWGKPKEGPTRVEQP
jgi:hypothetical protein